jgi:polyhydroxyalkanoate synthesis regulator phasin
MEGEMTDTKSTIGTVLGMKKTNKPTSSFPVVMDESQQLDESIKYAIAATNQLREELSATKAKLVEVTNAYANYKTDATNELMTQKHEYDSKLANTRADNDALRRQIAELGAKLEHYERMTFTLETKCEDFEKYFANSLGSIYDAGQHVAVSMVSTINNNTTSLSDAARHVADGLTKHIQHQVEDARAFLADIKAKAGQAEYRPVAAAYKPKAASEKLTEEAEMELANWIGRRPTIKAEHEEEDDAIPSSATP